METVQFECGTCHRVMAVSLEHLGAQVHCPHCQTIVQAPPAETPPSSLKDGGDIGREGESIFAGPAPTDDIFNSPPSGSKIEMPAANESPTLTDYSADAPLPRIPLMFSREPQEDDLSASDASKNTGRSAETPATWSDSAGSRGGHDSTFASPGALPPRRLPKSALAPLVLIFLVPYAIIATAVIAYLMLNRPQPFDPLERLPDPKPKDGGPREQVKHDSFLPDKLRTRLKQPLAVGSVEVTPLKVEHVKDDLVLSLRIKNLSKDLVFNPISEEFFKYGKGVMSTSRPYTYLAWSGPKIYGGFPEWLRGPAGKEEPFGGEIGPGQEELFRLFTVPQYHDAVKRLLASRETMLWRVQVRRGFVEVHGTPVSATAVVGVEFNAKDIEPDRDS